MERRPWRDGFSEASFPALKIKIGYAKKGTNQERSLQKAQCADVIEMDITFNEPVINVETIKLGEDGAKIKVYSLIDLIAEKLRAQLQQVERKHERYRPQDFYDIALLIEQYDFSQSDRVDLLAAFKLKCQSREIEPTIDSISNPAVITHAKQEWNSLALEIGVLPAFEECFKKVEIFYRSLWTES